MDELFVLFFALVVLALVLAVVTLVGHGIWIALRALIREVTGKGKVPAKPEAAGVSRCANCGFLLAALVDFCGICGARRPSAIVVELLKDLSATARQLERFHRAGTLDDETLQGLKENIEAEKARLVSGRPAPAAPSAATEAPTAATPPSARPPEPSHVSSPPSVPAFNTPSVISEPATEPAFGRGVFGLERTTPPRRPEPPIPPPTPPPPAAKRKPFAEVLAAFMEQSNIRWGEIVGGLLIIGCSTALVVSLWTQISRIPLLKFLIFTTVTAALFGVGLYTHHRWKLPTTSRGILTIATLLVPLNFLAIAAVSGNTIPAGGLVIASEVIAPAVFFCLVYFAGRVITEKWPHVLALGVLGSSVGQLLIRHFAAPDNSPTLLLILGVVPVVTYVAAAAWMLILALADKEIDDNESTAILITLGAITFASALPFGLLLYKSGPVPMTMMYLAPLVTLAGVPMLASGTLLWKRVTNKELLATRTAGTSIALVGTAVVLSGMVLAWPNPASIVPAALFNFAVLTALAILLELPFAHVLAAGCLALAYLVSFHVFAGHLNWQNLRVVSLLNVMTTAGSGQSFAVVFVLFLAVAEWLRRKGRVPDSRSYQLAAGLIGAISLVFITVYGAE
jgi:hypothetical protein